MKPPSKSWEALEMLARFKGSSLGRNRRHPASVSGGISEGIELGYWIDAKSYWRAVHHANLPRKQVVALALAMRGAFLRNFTEGAQ